MARIFCYVKHLNKKFQKLLIDDYEFLANFVCFLYECLGFDYKNHTLARLFTGSQDINIKNIQFLARPSEANGYWGGWQKCKPRGVYRWP